MTECNSLMENLGMEFLVETPERVEVTMPVTPRIFQPFKFVHGGATIALLESAASRGAELMTDFSAERPFGIEAHIHHRKSGTKGTVRGVAQLNHVEGSKQFWDVTAYDDEGDVMSEGTFVTKIVTLARLEEKAREREAQRKSAQELR